MPTSSGYKTIINDPQFLFSVLNPSAPLQHILFDCDGLILDTEPIYSRVFLLAIRHLLLPLNKTQDDLSDDELFPPSLKLKIMGGDKVQVAQTISSHLNASFNLSITPDQWISLTLPLEIHHFSLGCPLMPAIAETIRLFSKINKWPIAVATSSARQTFLIKSSPHSALFAHFNHITCGDDPNVKGKPDPSIFHSARHHLNRLPSHPGLVLEDSPNGVVAALRSGHSCIWVPSASVSGSDGFNLINSILSDSKLPSNDLWVYKATSLQEIVSIFQ